MFSPLDLSDVWMAGITAVTIMLAAPSGVGGGGILVPMYLVFGLNPPFPPSKRPPVRVRSETSSARAPPAFATRLSLASLQGRGCGESRARHASRVSP